MTSQTAIITGANSGLGFSCARSLLDRDPTWHVLLAVRDAARGQESIERLQAPARCTVMPLDLASLASVSRFVDKHRDSELPPTRAIVCNAGVQVISGTRRTEDGLEMTFGVNHLGHFALVTGLLEQLQAPARIVIVASDTHDPTKHTGMPAPRYENARALALPSDDEGGDRAMTGRCRYTTSKLCNILMAYELDRRLRLDTASIPEITVNAFDPGLMPGTGLARDYGRISALAWRYLLPGLTLIPGLNIHTTRQSGRSLARLVTDPDLAATSGRYFSGDRDVASSTESHDPTKAADLWKTSEDLLASNR